MPYSVSEQKGEMKIEVEGSSLNEVFMDGARALFSVMSDSDHLKSDERVKVVIDAKDTSSLFGAWIKELADRSEQYNVLFGECSIASIQKVHDSQYLFTGAAYGETYDASKHSRKIVVKGVKDAMVEDKNDKGHFLASYLLSS